MNKNNLIRFAQSLILLPFMTTMPMLGMSNIVEKAKTESLPIVFNQKEDLSTFVFGILPFNKEKDFVNDKEQENKEQERQLKAKMINEYFVSRDMPMQGTGMKMVIEAEKNNLDWRLIPAISVRESTGGKFECKNADFNSFGWGSCKINFDSNDHAIETIARNLGGNNPNTAQYYAGKDLRGILEAYNPPSVVLTYAEEVISIMDAIGESEVSEFALAK